MKITKKQLRGIIKEELAMAMREARPLDRPHAGKSVEEIVMWHTSKWDKNISDYSRIMPPDLIDYVINTMMDGVIDTMRDPETRAEYYSHLSDEEYEFLINSLNQERQKRL